ncbi:MAG: phosphatase PAP2 family protein [FCB group bacterium]|nr:phosphatase PAP2 family protein [FCB group bacterium]
MMIVLIFILGHPLQAYYKELIFYASMAAVAALIIRYIDEDRNRFYKLIRLLYPGLMFTFFYWETGGLMFLVFNHFFDAQLTAFEKILFGINPTIYIDRHLLGVWINEIFSFSYFSYYFWILIFLLVLFIKKDYEIIKSYLTATTLTFFLSYIIFFLYPIEGPRWYFAGQYIHQIEGPIFRKLVNLLISKGAVRGGCMPSTHFGVALVIILYCFKYYRKTGWILLPLLIGLGIGTVWGRFHYVSDVFVGGTIGLIMALLVWKFYPIPPRPKHHVKNINR